MSNEQFITHSSQETHRLGAQLGERLPAGTILTFSGELGSGKTTLIRGLIEQITQTPAREVCSPTFNYLNIYTGTTTVYHFDLYRLNNPHAFLSAGFADFLGGTSICCIEWPEVIETLLPSSRIHVVLTYCGEGTRKIEVIR